MIRLAAFFFGAALLASCATPVEPADGLPATERQEVETVLSIPASARAATLVTFVGLDSGTGRTYVLNPEAASRRFTPYSTFKIPNYLIAIESRAIEDPETVFPWDAARRPRASYWPDEWARDHTLDSAFRASAVWFFQDIALTVGSGRYREFLQRFDYGDAAVPEGSDDFWLDGSLRVSPREQVGFLARLLRHEVGLAPSTLEALRAATLLRRDGGYELHGKTGAGPLEPSSEHGAFGGWLVGWVERPRGGPFLYAMYLEAPGFRELWSMRSASAADLLKQAGALPVSWP